MIPFARILTYGNIREIPYIKQMNLSFSSNVSYSILLSTGDAYVGGYNAYGQLGLGHKSDRPRSLFKIPESDIKLCTNGIGSTIYISHDDKIFLSGDRAIQNNSGTASGYTTFTDISNLFSSINISDIKKIVPENNTFVLLNNGELYGIGLNRYGELGVGSTGYFPLTLIDTDVEDCSITSQNSVYIKKDGTVWGAGRNASYCIKTSTEGGINNENIVRFHRMFSTVSEPILQVRMSTNNTIAYTKSTVYCIGTNSAGAFGDGNTTNTNQNTSGNMITVELPNSCNDYNYFGKVYTMHSGVSMYVDINNRLYSTGNNYNYALGLGTSPQYIGTYTIVPDIICKEHDIIICNYYNGYICRDENIILGCGKNTNPTCLTNDIFNGYFQSLMQLPWKL
ncbi:hypothetical protein K3335_003758 [Salmonella enterica]|nr:hypothetical protein [Salmonella enterica]